MRTEVIMLAMLGIIQLTINITTMFLILPAKRSVRFSVGAAIIFTVIIFGILFLTGQIDNEFAGLIGLAYLPLMICLFKGHFFQKIFAFFLQYLLTTLQISFSVTAVGLFTGNQNKVATVVGLMANVENTADIVLVFILTLCMFAVYITLMFKYGRLVFQKLFAHEHPAEWMLYSFGAIFSFAIMVVIRNTPINPWLHIFVLLFILWSFMILCFAIINAHEKSRQRYETEFARDIISSGRDHYQKMNEMYETLRILRHDYKYHLNTIDELLNAGNKSETEKYLSDIKKQFVENEFFNYCSNPVLNALLVSYSERCGKLNIKYDIEISLPKTITIPNYEMCIILGNLLENAVEACGRQENDRKIQLIINTQGTHLAIMVKNSFNGEITSNYRVPKSTKKDGGLGLRSVQAVAARYKGELMTEWDSKMFAAYVLIRL